MRGACGNDNIKSPQPANVWLLAIISKPDLNWGQVKETVLMMNVAVSHIEKTMRDGDDSINTLGETFTSGRENPDY